MTQPRDLVAVADYACLSDEVVLKQLVVMFNRIAIPPLAMLSNNTLEPKRFIKTRAWLAGMGILFEPDMDRLMTPAADPQEPRKNADMFREDVEFLLTPSGVNLEEWKAARGDQKKLSELKQKAAEANLESAFSSIDPERYFKSIQRITTFLPRLLAIQLRAVENVEAYAVLGKPNELAGPARRPARRRFR